VAGSGVGAFGAWQGNVAVERRRENLEVLGAMEMLELEIEENADRVRKGAYHEALPLGVWKHSKPILAGVGRRAVPDELWRELNRVYRRIYDARSKARLDPEDEPLTLAALEKLQKDFGCAADSFAKTIRSPRFWLWPEPPRRR
jgi:hypothetical protein